MCYLFHRYQFTSNLLFQVLTQCDWYAVLYDAMMYTSPAAAVYFLLLLILGYYVLFSLFVAILIDGFSTEGDAVSITVKFMSITRYEEKNR